MMPPSQDQATEFSLYYSVSEKLTQNILLFFLLVLAADWKEMYIYRQSCYKHLSCLLVGSEGAGKRSLVSSFDAMVTREGWQFGKVKDNALVCVESYYGIPIMFNLTVLKTGKFFLSTGYIVFIMTTP